MRAIQLAQHDGGTRETASACAACATYFLNGPVETCFDGCGGGVDVVAIQTQSRFEAQGIASTQTNGLHFCLR